MILGSGRYTYQAISDWAQLPAGWQWGWIPAVACDSQDRVYVYTRSAHPLVVFDREGRFIEERGAGILQDAHGITVDAEDNVYCTEHSAHAVYKFDPRGELVLTLGTPGTPAAREGEPFNQPTDLAIAPTGELFVSDGYGQTRVHKFSADGELLLSWGERGDGPGQFALPHGVRVDRYDRVWVCDRENDRIQLFDMEGRYLEQRTGLKRPAAICFDPLEDVVYVAELDHRVSIYTLDGEWVAQWDEGCPNEAAGILAVAPHGICVDSHGDLYVGEVWQDGRLKKFVRQG